MARFNTISASPILDSRPIALPVGNEGLQTKIKIKRGFYRDGFRLG